MTNSSTGDGVNEPSDAVMAQTLPLFPLSTVLVPGLVMPIHVFEPRYRRLVEDLQHRPIDQRRFGVVAIRDGVDVGADGVKSFHRVGTTAEVREITTLPDGRSALTIVGGTRFEVREVNQEVAPYLVAHVAYLPEVNGGEPELLVPKVIAAYRAYRQAIAAWTTDDDSDRALTDEPDLLSYLVASTTVLDLSERQSLLEAPTIYDRLVRALHLLRREAVLAEELSSLPSSDYARVDISLN